MRIGIAALGCAIAWCAFALGARAFIPDIRLADLVLGSALARVVAVPFAVAPRHH